MPKEPLSNGHVTHLREQRTGDQEAGMWPSLGTLAMLPPLFYADLGVGPSWALEPPLHSLLRGWALAVGASDEEH